MRYFSTYLLVVIISLVSCTYTAGEGPIVERELKLAAFSGVELDGSFDVSIEQGAAQHVIALGQENILDVLQAEVMDDVLYLSLKPGSYFNYDLEIKVTVPTLNHVTLNGSGDIKLGTFVKLNGLQVKLDGSGDIKSDGPLEVLGTANIELEGSGDIELTLKASETNAILEGSGDIKLDGTTSKLAVSLDGSGDIKAYDLESLNCVASVEGAGDIRVSASKKLEASVDGSGNISYRGEPKVTAQIDGSGSIDQD